MGIPGIYKEIGPGERISLAKLSVDHLEKTGHSFRLAVDVSIWDFQAQSGQGGRNPALRTIYYRLLKLLALSIKPLFVFDGPGKPKFKRNVKVASCAANKGNFLTKQLLKRFGFPSHDAPGEAEAECALLQKEGIVDAVLSEDVDTVMFGCTRSLRNWSAENAKNKTPTHVNMYTAEATKKNAGLDSQGMILVALMSGGDYNTEGLSKCGPKTACEAARAGFARELCQLVKDDLSGWGKWRERLQHELRTNESKFFARKHATIKIPHEFPDQTVLDYYKYPAVSSADKVASLRHSLKWNLEVDVPGLRAFVAEAFHWPHLMGAKHFIKTLAPCLIAHRLIEVSRSRSLYEDDLEVKASAEEKLVKTISGQRTHWNTDGSLELRIAYVPADIVGLDLSLEQDIDRRDDDEEVLELEEQDSDREERSRSVRPTKRRGPFNYDPNQSEKIWMLETFVKLGVPLLVETWEEDMKNPKKFASRKAREKAALSRIAQQGPMDRFAKITKAGMPPAKSPRHVSAVDVGITLPPTFLAPAIATGASYMAEKALEKNHKTGKSSKKKAAAGNKNKSTSQKATVEEDAMLSPSPSNQETTPWTLSRRPLDTYGFKSPSRYSALGIYAPDDPENKEPRLRNLSSPHKPKVMGESLVSPPPSTMPTPTRNDSREFSAPSEERDTEGCATLPLANITLRTPRRREATKPSPSKKQSSPEMANDLTIAGCLHTPLSVTKQREYIDVDQSDTPDTPAPEALAVQRPNRRLQYPTATNNTVRPLASKTSPASDHSSLPSPSALFSPQPDKAATINQQALSKVSHHPSPSKPLLNKDVQKLIALRESLEGAWKPLQPWEASELRDVFGSVEVLDLTT